MVLAAYANDHEEFTRALNNAKRQAMDEGIEERGKWRKLTPDEAMKKVVSLYEGQNPMNIVFRSKPTALEYQRLLAQLPGDGKQAVMQAISLYQHYGSQIGATINSFAKEKADDSFKLPALTLDGMKARASVHGLSL
jgi:hypothetical protein